MENEIVPPKVLKSEKSENSNELFEIDDRIFCGLTANPSMPIDVIIKCDNLGRDLANALIEKGALEVMKVSQDYIRNSTAAKNS